MATTNLDNYWNPGCSNQESDSQYAADAQRLGGATDPSLFASALANKHFYQDSIVRAALAAALVDKGLSPNDGSANPATAFNNLVAVLANLVTFTAGDLAALFASPVLTGDPKAPDQPVGDNDQSIANTKFVKSVLGASGGYAASLTSPSGYIKFPSALGGLVLQWALGDTGGSPAVNMPVAFPLNMPAAALAVLGATKTGTQTFSVNFSGNSWLLTGNGTYWLFAIGH